MHSIARLGIRYVDYFAAKQGDPRGLSREERVSLIRSVESLGLSASNMVMILPGNIASGDRHELARCLEYVKACLELSRDMGGRQVLLAAGERAVGMPSAMAWENARHALNIIADEAASYDQYVTLELEPCVYSLRGEVCPTGGTPPIGNPVSRFTASASARMTWTPRCLDSLSTETGSQKVFLHPLRAFPLSYSSFWPLPAYHQEGWLQ